jgi:transposase
MGMTSIQIAEAIGWSPSTVRNIQSAYSKVGESALSSNGRGGRNNEYLDPAEEKRLLQPFLKYTRTGHPLNVKAIHSAYERQIGCAVPKSTVYRLISRHGLSHLLGRKKRLRSD